MSEYEPFVAFIPPAPDAELDTPLPTTFSLSEGGSPFFEVLQQKILDTGEDDELIAPNNNVEGPGKISARPPDRATNDTAANRDAPDLEPFAEMNAREKRAPWKERYEVIKTQFPSVENLNWEKVFRADPTIMGNILNDIIKAQVAPKGRPGKRPALNREEAQEVLKQYRGEDYTLLPFAKAVNRLKKTASVRQFARKVSMSPTYAHNLITGYKQPSIQDMILVAEAYGKNPSFFYEYRVAFIAAVMAERVDYAPEASVIYYERAMTAYQEHS